MSQRQRADSMHSVGSTVSQESRDHKIPRPSESLFSLHPPLLLRHLKSDGRLWSAFQFVFTSAWLHHWLVEWWASLVFACLFGWSPLCNAILHSQAASLRFCCMWFYVSDGSFLYVKNWSHWSGVHTALFGCYIRCHVKLLLSRHVLCTPYSCAACLITSCKATCVGCMRA